jgi:hypothetical protein
MDHRAARGLIVTAAAAAALAWGGPLHAQVSETGEAAALPQSGVTSYEPSFFDEFRPTNALSMVNNIQGFSVQSGGNARGFAANAGNVLIDGQRPPTGNDNLTNIIARIPVSAVERIDVIRGGAGGIDMQGYPIVANIIRKQDTAIGGAVSANANVTTDGDINGGFSVNAQRQSGGRSLEGALSANMNDGGGMSESRRVDPAGTVLYDARSEGEFISQNYTVTAAHDRPLAGGDFRINGQYQAGTNESRNLTELIIPVGEQETSRGEGDNSSAELGLRYGYERAGGTTLEAVLINEIAENNSESQFITPDFTQRSRSSRKNGQSIGTGTISLPKKGNWKFDGGAEVAYNWFETSSQFSLDGSNVFIPGNVTEVDEIRGEIFSSANWTPKDSLSAQFGLRYETSTLSTISSGGDVEKTLSFLKPRVNVSWRPKQGHEVTVNLERTVDQLSFGDFTVSANFVTGVLGASNPDIEPAKTWTAEARYQYRFGRRGSFMAQYIYRRIEDPLGSVILRIPASGTTPERIFDFRTNVFDEARHSLRFSGNLPLEPFGLEGAYVNASLSFNESETRDPVTGVLRRVSGENPYNWNVGFSREMNEGKINYSVGVQGGGNGVSYSPRSISQFTNLKVVIASFSWRPKPELTFSANAITFFGENESRFILYDAPRDVGMVRYVQTGISEQPAQISLNVRRTF